MALYVGKRVVKALGLLAQDKNFWGMLAHCSRQYVVQRRVKLLLLSCSDRTPDGQRITSGMIRSRNIEYIDWICQK